MPPKARSPSARPTSAGRRDQARGLAAWSRLPEGQQQQRHAAPARPARGRHSARSDRRRRHARILAREGPVARRRRALHELARSGALGRSSSENFVSKNVAKSGSCRICFSCQHVLGIGLRRLAPSPCVNFQLSSTFGTDDGSSASRFWPSLAPPFDHLGRIGHARTRRPCDGSRGSRFTSSGFFTMVSRGRRRPCSGCPSACDTGYSTSLPMPVAIDTPGPGSAPT